MLLLFFFFFSLKSRILIWFFFLKRRNLIFKRSKFCGANIKNTLYSKSIWISEHLEGQNEIKHSELWITKHYELVAKHDWNIYFKQSSHRIWLEAICLSLSIKCILILQPTNLGVAWLTTPNFSWLRIENIGFQIKKSGFFLRYFTCFIKIVKNTKLSTKCIVFLFIEQRFLTFYKYLTLGVLFKGL